MEVLSTIRDMQAAREDISLESISRWLRERGLYVPASGTHISGIKAWLKKAGVLDDAYTINEETLANILGASAADAEALGELTKPQLAFLKALALLPDMPAYPSNKVAQYAQELYGVEFPPKSLAAGVVDPLERVGYIAKQKTTAGRGAKAHSVSRTEKFRTEYILPLFTAIESSSGLKYRELFRKPLDEILLELKSTDRSVRGKALEALAVFLMRLLDLELVAWRLRARDTTASAEVDVIVEGARFVFSRWQIQCKNTAKVALDDVAKEVGLMGFLGSQVAMVVGTGAVSQAAKTYAEMVRDEYGKQVVVLGRREILAVANDSKSLLYFVRTQAPFAMVAAR